MSPVVQIILALASVGMLIALMAVIRRVAGIWQIGAEVQRKLVHIGTGLYALILPWLFPEHWPVYLLVGLSLVVMLMLRLPNSKLGGTLHGVERQSYGDFLLAISIGLCLFLSQGLMFLYVLPIAVLTLADAAAALAGSKYGTRYFRVEDGNKSIEGSGVFFLVTLIISTFCLMIMTEIPPLNIIVLSLMIAGFGTVVEATSWRGYDNLFLPMGILIFLSVHGLNDLNELVTLAALFVAGTVAFMLISPKLGLTRHAASVYVTTIFLLLSGTSTQNAIVPILVLAAHAWSRSATPCQSKYPDLDVVVGLSLIGFGWWVLGNATGYNALSFFGITAMGMLMGFCAIAVGSKSPMRAVAVLVILLIALCGFRAVTIALNQPAENWNGPMWPVVCLSLAVTTLAGLFWPAGLVKWRVAKITTLSLLVPLVWYVISINLAGT